MGRQTSSLVATFTLDLKDRSGITVQRGIKLGTWVKEDNKLVNHFNFLVTDPGDSKVNKLADKLFDKYFEKIIYPAVQAFRFILPRHRVNVNITLTGHVPYNWSQERYYTGEYITYIKVLPKFETYHDAYYVARAILNQTSLNDVKANLERCKEVAYYDIDYPYVKKNYRNACLIGKALCTDRNYPADSHHLIVDDANAMKYFYGSKVGNLWIHQLWWRSHHDGEVVGSAEAEGGLALETEDDDSIDFFKDVLSTSESSNDIYIPEEGIFDSFFDK